MMEDLQITYNELAYVMNMTVKESKAMFAEIMDTDPKPSSTLSIKELMVKFGNTGSIDQRYDKINKLLFIIERMAPNYMKYINDPRVIKKQAFTRGKTIYYKLMSPAQLEHFKSNIKTKQKYLDLT